MPRGHLCGALSECVRVCDRASRRAHVCGGRALCLGLRVGVVHVSMRVCISRCPRLRFAGGFVRNLFSPRCSLSISLSRVQVVCNMLDFGMDPQAALDAARFCVCDTGTFTLRFFTARASAISAGPGFCSAAPRSGRVFWLPWPYNSAIAGHVWVCHRFENGPGPKPESFLFSVSGLFYGSVCFNPG